MEQDEFGTLIPSTSSTRSNEKNQISVMDVSEDCAQVDESTLSAWISTFTRLPQSVQDEALTNLITLCSYSQIRHLQSVITPFFQRDFISCLPKELSLRILSFLPPIDLVNASTISRYWRKITEDELLWASKCREYGITELSPPNFTRRIFWKEQNLQNTSIFPLISDNIINTLNLPITNNEDLFEKAAPALVDSDYPTCLKRSRSKAIYLRSKRIFSNWCNRRPTAVCELKGHEEHVITCLQLHGDLIVTGSDDHTIRIWSASTAKCLHILRGHTGGVWALQLSEDGKTVVSGATDRTVRVWSSETGNLIHSLTGHTSTVRCMALSGKILVTGSRDCSIRIWDIEEGRCLRILFGHMASVRCVQFDGSIIVSGAYDSNIIVWNAVTGAQIHILHGHTARVYSLLLNKERGLIASGSLDTYIKIWNLRTGECLQNLVGHSSLTSGMQFVPRTNLLISANADCSIKIWEITTGQCIHTLSGANRHTSAVTSLQYLNNGLLVTGDDGGFVKLWNIFRGEFVCDLLRFGGNGSGNCVWKVEATPTILVCAIGSRNQTEDTRLVLMDFETPYP